MPPEARERKVNLWLRWRSGFNARFSGNLGTAGSSISAVMTGVSWSGEFEMTCLNAEQVVSDNLYLSH